MSSFTESKLAYEFTTNLSVYVQALFLSKLHPDRINSPKMPTNFSTALLSATELVATTLAEAWHNKSEGPK